MNSYLIECEDTTAKLNEEKKLIKKEKFEDSTISTYDIEETLLENALEDLDTYSFLSSKKTIIIKNIEILKYDENKKDLDHLFKYIDNPQTDKLLIIEVKKLNNTTKLAKELKKKCKVVEISNNTKSYIKNKFKGYEINQDAINLLDEYCLGDITKIENECEKLKNYKYNEKIINKEDIKELVIKKLGDSKELTFQFTRALAERDKENALRKYKELLDYNIDAFGIIGLLASQLRIIYQVKLLEKRNMSDKEIANTLGEKSDYRIRKTRELTRYYTEKDLLNLMIELEKIDLKMKSTGTSVKHLLEMFILNI